MGGRGWHRLARPAAVAGLVGLLAPAGAAAASTGWSTPAVVSRCATATLPRVVFPDRDPYTSAGPGAILWNGDPATCGSETGPAGSGVGLASIAAGDVAGPAQSLPLAAALPSPPGRLAATAGIGDGRILVAAGLGSNPAAPVGLFEGRVAGGFGRPDPLRALPAPVVMATSYTGLIALVTVRAATNHVELRLQAPGAPSPSPPTVISARRTPVTALAVGLDYRGDALVVWAEGGSIYRRVLRTRSRLDAAERIASTPAAVHLQAVISDDNRGIVAWSADTTTGTTTRTHVYVDVSRSGVHFGAPRQIDGFRDPPTLRLPDGSLRLVRLANEGVMIAWTGMSRGHYAVRAATVGLNGHRPTSLVSNPASDAVLTDLATGSHNEALAVWSTAPRLAAGFDAAHAQVVAARGVAEAPGLAVFGPPETVAGPGPVVAPRAGIDPATDTAVAVWEQLGAEPGVAYSVRPPGAALRRVAPVHVKASPAGLPAVAWILVGVVGLGGLVAVRARRRGPHMHRGRRMVSARPGPRDRSDPLV